MGGQQYLHHLVDQFHTWVAERRGNVTKHLQTDVHHLLLSPRYKSESSASVFHKENFNFSFQLTAVKSKAVKNNDICWQVVPVLKKSGFFKIQFGMTSAVNMEKPKINIFLEEFISVDWKIETCWTLNSSQVFGKNIKPDFVQLFTCRLEMPVAVMTPNMIRNIPPSTGVGMVVKMAPILPSIPIRIMKTPLRRITVRLPTCHTNKQFVYFADLLVLMKSPTSSVCPSSVQVAYGSRFTRAYLLETATWKLPSYEIMQYEWILPWWYPGQPHSHWTRWCHCLCQKPLPGKSRPLQRQCPCWWRASGEEGTLTAWRTHGSRPRTLPWSILFQPSCQKRLPGSPLACPIDLREESKLWLLNGP